MRTLRQGIPAFRPRAAATVLLQILPSESGLSSEKGPGYANGSGWPVSKPTKTKRKSEPELDKQNFERMMDGSHEDTLREIVGRLREALHDPSTPANALPSISSKLAEFDERMRMAEESGSLFDANDDVTEVAEDVGASIV